MSIVYDNRTETLTVHDEREGEILMYGMPDFEEIEIEEPELNLDHLIFCRPQAD